RSSVSPVSPCLCVFHRASIMVINFLFSIMTDSFLLGIVSITLNPEKVKSYSQKMGYFLLFFLKDQKPTVRIIVDSPLLPFIPDTAVKGHDCSHDAIDLFRTFCLRRFDITCRIGVHHHISRHPAHNRVAAMDDATLHQEFITFLCWRRHILQSLTKRYHGKPHAFQILRHLHCAPTVKGDFQDVILLTQPLYKFLNETVMDH